MWTDFFINPAMSVSDDFMEDRLKESSIMPKLCIERATYLEGYVLSLDFSSGVTKQVDFAPFLLNALHPDVQKYRDLEKFKQFTVTNGDLYWNDYELCFPVADLYQNQL